MNNKPWAYVTSAWSADRTKAKRSAKRYCRKLYEGVITNRRYQVDDNIYVASSFVCVKC